METRDLAGAVWLPGDGKANPADLTLALAKGARKGHGNSGGVTICEGVRVTGTTHFHTDRRRGVRSLAWQAKDGSRGEISAEIVVLCGGQWSRALGRVLGVTVPLFSCEHYYIVTDRIDGVHRDLPVMRDPDGYIYFKEEVGGLLMGGFEPHATPWLQSAQHRGGIPENFEFQLLPDNWDAFQILLDNAMIRVPALETAQVKQFYNGPESFTADNNFIVGPAPGLDNLYVGAGFNSMGIASGGGAGKALAEWIVQGEPTMDLWPVDIRRFACFNGNETWLPDRIAEVLGMHYKMPWPNRELESARPFRRSPLYGHLKERGACFGSKMGWERANFFAPSPAEAKIEYGWGHQNWHPWVAAEHRACREAVAVFDMSSFAKLQVAGPDARTALQWLVANDMPSSAGATVYTGMLNERGGYESDFTITCVSDDEFMIVTSSGSAVRDRDVIERAFRDEGWRCTVNEVTPMYTMLAVMGPRSRELMQRVSTARFDNASFPFGTSQEIDVGYATVRATRLTYVGELGWELYTPVEFAIGVYEQLIEAGRDLGLVNAGYYAIDSLRLEKGYRAWGRELTPDINPYEAGLSFAVKLDKAGGFRGRDALARVKAEGSAAAVKRRVVSLVVDAPHTNLWGNELILREGLPAGFVTSAAFGHTIGKPVALGIVSRADGAADKAWIESGRYEIDLAGERYAAQVSLRAPYDPDGVRVKS
jgi:4-methylaminobutanoate oxidase (formaldehyde-forming)